MTRTQRRKLEREAAVLREAVVFFALAFVDGNATALQLFERVKEYRAAQKKAEKGLDIQ